MNEVSDFSVMRKRWKWEIAEATANRKASRKYYTTRTNRCTLFNIAVEESDRLKIEIR